MLIRDNKFDEITLPDQRSKIETRVSKDESKHICPRMEEDRACLSTPIGVMHILQTFSAHARSY
jgi:hypothetical protein